MKLYFLLQQTLVVFILFTLSFLSLADDPCSRVSRPNPFAPAADGAATGYSFD